jgi:Glycosyl transferases group 1
LTRNGTNAPRTLLIVDPARRFGSEVDRLFSDRLARAFYARGWTVKWAVDVDDDLSASSYASIHRILPPSRISGEVIAAPQVSRDQNRIAHCGSWPGRQLRAGLSAIRRGLSSAYWRGMRKLDSSLRRVIWTIHPCVTSLGCQYTRWASSRFRAVVHRLVAAVAATQAPTSPTSSLHDTAATSSSKDNGPDSGNDDGLLGLLRLCGSDDLIVFPAAETVHLETLLGLLPSLKIAAPLPTTLHMRFTSAPRLLVGRGELDTKTIAARLTSGAPVRSLVFHAEGAAQAARYAREIGLPVGAMDTVAENYGPDAPDAKLMTLFLHHRSADTTNDGTAVPSLVVEKLGPVALVIGALWGRVGSSAVFDAQTRYLIDRGYIVIRVLIEHWPHYGQKRVDRIATFVAENFENVRPHHHFIAARNDSLRRAWQLAAKPEFRTASPVRRIQYLLAEPTIEQPRELAWCAKRAALAIVNHLPHVGFAEQLTQAPIVLETHDIYSRLLDSHGIPGFVPRGPDGQPLRMAEEKEAWARVAACVNISPEDHEEVARVAKFSVLARPYVMKRHSMRSWPEVLGANRLDAAFRTANLFDVMLWGSWHDANVRGITWFLEKVVTAQEVLQRSRILLVGRVVEGLDKALLRRNNLLVAGFVDTLDDFASRTSVLVIPDQSGTGTSIKAMDAFALGACFASTRFGVRGIDMGDTGYAPSTDAEALAADIVRLLGSATACRERADVACRLYDLNFSAEAYNRAWDRVVATVAGAAQQRTMAILATTAGGAQTPVTGALGRPEIRSAFRN